jgi:hypothetical protein
MQMVELQSGVVHFYKSLSVVFGWFNLTQGKNIQPACYLGLILSQAVTSKLSYGSVFDFDEVPLLFFERESQETYSRTPRIAYLPTNCIHISLLYP